MQNKPKLRHFLCYVLAIVIVATIALLIECVVFQFPAIRYKQKPISLVWDGSDERLTFAVEDVLAQLTEDEIRSIEVERDNQKMLAEYNGEEYVEPGIYAVTNGYLNKIDVDKIPEFELRLREFMDNSQYSCVLTAIRETGKLEKDTEEKLKAALSELLVEFENIE